MTNFITFIVEDNKKKTAAKEPEKKAKGLNSELVMQKVVNMVDDGHVEQDDDKIVINVGKLIKNSDLYDLFIIIRKGPSQKIRIGKNTTDGKIAIVIETKRLPMRHKIDTFLTHVDRYQKVINAMEKFFKNHYVSSEEMPRDATTSYEKGKNANQRATFEEQFKQLKAAMTTHLANYKSSKREIERELETVGSPARKSTLKMALDHLKKEELGSTSKEFVSKMMKLVDKDFLAHLEKEWKDKLTKRLEDYYDHLEQ